jgi:group I intron endonuclease
MIYNAAKDTKKKQGVYVITNSIDDRFYIGGTSHGFMERFKTHRDDLKSGKHHSIHLQRFVNKYGLDKLTFEVLEICEKSQAFDREQYYLDTLQPYLPSIGFNHSRSSKTSLGVRHTAQARKNMSEAQIKRFRALGIVGTKKKKLSPEERAEYLKSRIGRKMSEEAKKKMREAILSDLDRRMKALRDYCANKPRVEKPKKERSYKKIYQYDLDCNLIKVWNKASEIEKELNHKVKYIRMCCAMKDNTKTYKGFIWAYNELVNTSAEYLTRITRVKREFSEEYKQELRERVAMARIKGLAYSYSEENIQRLKTQNIGRKHSEETKNKIREANKQRKLLTI